MEEIPPPGLSVTASNLQSSKKWTESQGQTLAKTVIAQSGSQSASCTSDNPEQSGKEDPRSGRQNSSLHQGEAGIVPEAEPEMGQVVSPPTLVG